MAIVPKARAAAPAAATNEEQYPCSRQRVRAAAPAQPQPAATGDFEVGYRKPPKHTRFKPGQSGNRAGRPKGAKGMRTLVKALLTEKIAVRTPGGVKRMSKMEAALHKVAEKAFAGDIRSLELLIRLYSGSVPDEVSAAVVSAQVAATRVAEEDEALAALEDILRGQLLGNDQGAA